MHEPTPVDVQALRARLKMSQDRFARAFGLPKRTVQDWEQGRRQPEGAARVLLKVIKREPDAVRRALAAQTLNLWDQDRQQRSLPLVEE